MTEQLLNQAREIINLLDKQMIIKDKLLLNLQAQIETYNEQINIQDKEITKIKFKGKIGIGLGVAIGIAIGFILK